jgi:hypothetical protein
MVFLKNLHRNKMNSSEIDPSPEMIEQVRNGLQEIVSRGLELTRQRDQINNAIELFTFILNYFDVVSHSSFRNTFKISIKKMNEFRATIVKDLDINYGYGTEEPNYKILLNILDSFENKVKELDVGLIIEPFVASFDINHVLERQQRASVRLDN